MQGGQIESWSSGLESMHGGGGTTHTLSAQGDDQELSGAVVRRARPERWFRTDMCPNFLGTIRTSWMWLDAGSSLIPRRAVLAEGSCDVVFAFLALNIDQTTSSPHMGMKVALRK